MEDNKNPSEKGLVDILIGLMWGDEGKGKAILDLLSMGTYEASARYQGGPNAGHTLYVDGKKFVAHMLPSGVALPNIKQLLIGNDAVIDPIKLVAEIKEAEALGMSVRDRLKISALAGLISPYHKILDAAAEWAKKKNGSEEIGTTGSGMGPSYGDAASRDGLKLGMANWSDFAERVVNAKHRHEMLLGGFIAEGMPFSEERRRALEGELSEWKDAIEWLNCHVLIADINGEVRRLLASGKNILAEGAQGVFLDVGFGDYPFTTSSVTTAHGVFHGLGIGPGNFGTLYGVLKPYVTKVGGGPFPSRMPPEIEQLFQEEGEEVGATTGRKRMCGYLDLVALRHAVELHSGFGTMKLYITKADKFPKKVKKAQIVTDYYYLDGSASDKLAVPLSNVVKAVAETTPAWHVKNGQKEYVSDIGLDMLVNSIRSALVGLDAEVAYIGSGCNVGECFTYPSM